MSSPGQFQPCLLRVRRRYLLVSLGYPLGYWIVIIGRPFTENTLTAVIPLLARRDLASGQPAISFPLCWAMFWAEYPWCPC